MDITDVLEAEHARRLGMMARDCADAVIAQDFSGNILAWNPAAERLYGYCAPPVLNSNIDILVPEDKQEEWRRVQQQIKRGNRVAPFISERITKGGNIVRVQITASLLINGQGEPKGVFSTERGLND
jgi:two-component system CheB/CheR fusion protein